MQDVANKTDSIALQEQYSFIKIGEQIAKALVQAAENQVTEANNVLASAKVVAEGIMAQINEQVKIMNHTNERLKMFSQSIADAHDKFNGKPQSK